jgi:cystathionine beta-lyase
MKYDFDQLIDRRDSNCVKYDKLNELFGRDDLLPMWVADMDFATPPFVIDAVRRRCDHPIFGYTCRGREWSDAIIAWQQERYGWTIEEEWLSFTPGIVSGIAISIHCFTQPGDGVLIQTPVYHPYIHVPRNNGREVVMSDLILPSADETKPSAPASSMQIDWERFERDAQACKLFLLCHPHNPGGRVWTREELVRMAEICARHEVLVISDEIHADLTLPGHLHIPFASVSEEAAQNSITLASPSKAFNMPGLTSSYGITPNPEVRQRFHTFLDNCELNLGHLFVGETIAAAYGNGTEWLDQCLAYIEGNIDFVEQTLRERMPDIGMIRPDASYLIYLDCRRLGITQEEINSLFTEGAHLALNDGSSFGAAGTCFMRLNIASPRAVVAEALDRLSTALSR